MSLVVTIQSVARRWIALETASCSHCDGNGITLLYKIVYLDNKLVIATMHGCNYNVQYTEALGIQTSYYLGCMEY